MSTPTVFLGIDPGASGGLARLAYDEDATAVAMPKTERDICDWFVDVRTTYFNHSQRVFALIENVGGFMGKQSGSPDDKNKASAHTMFTFGRSYGFLRGCLIASGIPFEEVLPRVWQKGVGITPKGRLETRTEWKNRLKSKAQQLYPQIHVTLATADALLIATYARRKYGMMVGVDGK